ncbi:hypothetical protein ACI2KG_11250 [Pseudomonas sp. NPDC089407]|uniref:hypothetical protein n=1 Tax=Pseudomonas sp. NPDC089407 TaxID=3364464 RepID=UPI00384FFDF4
MISTWSMILAAYLAYRKRNPAAHQASQFKLPGGVVTAVVTLGFLGFVLVLLALQPDTRLALCVMPLWFVFLLLAYRRRSEPRT